MGPSKVFLVSAFSYSQDTISFKVKDRLDRQGILWLGRDKTSAIGGQLIITCYLHNNSSIITYYKFSSKRLILVSFLEHFKKHSSFGLENFSKS